MSNKPVFLDLNSPECNMRFARSPLYQKVAEVHAYQVYEPVDVVTTLTNGIVETFNTAQCGDYVITNPGGEQYIVSEMKFLMRYRVTDTPGVYQSIGVIRAFSNPTEKPIAIMAPWGHHQYGDENCLLAQSVEVPTDRYIIGRAEFLETYEVKVDQ